MMVVLRKIVHTFYSIVALLIYGFFKLFKLIRGKRIVLCAVNTERIGHLAGNTELFLRRLRYGTVYDVNDIYIGYCTAFPVCNEQLVLMYKRVFPLIDRHLFLLKPFYTHTWITKTEFCHLLPFNSNEYYEFNNFPSLLSFTEEEEKRGRELLSEMGIKENDWFVCFHSRDPAYLNIEAGREDWSYHDYRDSDIRNYLKAAEYIAERGGFAIRMGAIVEKPLPADRHKRIIDYAVEYRSDFMDIFLLAHCRFFLGNTAGLWVVPTIFNVPLACANFIFFEHTPFRKGDLFIPKKLWSEKEGRLLSFREILDCGAGRFMKSEEYRQAGLKVIENSGDEILALAREMTMRIDGEYVTTDEDEKRQRDFHNLFTPVHLCYGTPARIGNEFLRGYIENR